MNLPSSPPQGGIGNLTWDAQGHEGSACVRLNSDAWCFYKGEEPQLQQSEIRRLSGGIENYCYIEQSSGDAWCQYSDDYTMPLKGDNSSDPKEFLGSKIDILLSNNWLQFISGDSGVDLLVSFDGNVSINYNYIRWPTGEKLQHTYFVNQYRQLSVSRNHTTCFLNDEGQIFMRLGTDNTLNHTLQIDRGSNNYGLDCLGGRNHVLSADGQLRTSFTNPTSTVGGFTDVIDFVGYAADTCLIRSDLSIYCYGQHSGGSMQNPTYIGTYQP